MHLLEIAHPAVDIDLRYATRDNITGRPIYRRAVALLHPRAHAALGRAADLASAQGLRLRVYDAYRPTEAQWALWEALPDPDFVADPRLGSSHGRGVAVDLGLADPSGRVLDMGTGFDDMTERSHHGRLDLPAAAQRNRALLLGIMVAAGWAHYRVEWWHYNLPDADLYPLLADGAAGPRLMGA
jgi:D-alanyl-D-alanine dipeptidase